MPITATIIPVRTGAPTCLAIGGSFSRRSRRISSTRLDWGLFSPEGKDGSSALKVRDRELRSVQMGNFPREEKSYFFLDFIFSSIMERSSRDGLKVGT